MTEQTKSAETSPRPPLPVVGLTGRASDSFRRVDYVPPDGEVHTESNASWWKRMTASGKPLPDHVSSDDVVENLSRQSSKGRLSTSSQDPSLPPPHSPRMTKTASAGRVGLPKVTLVAAEDTPREQEIKEKRTGEKSTIKAGTDIETPKTDAPMGKTDTTVKDIQTETPPPNTQQPTTEVKPQETKTGAAESDVVPNVNGGVAVAGVDLMTKEEDTVKLPDTETAKGVAAAAAMDTPLDIPSHRVSVETVHDKEVETVEPPFIIPEAARIDNPTDKTTAVDASPKETSTPNMTPTALKSSQTMAAARPQRSFLRRMFTFGSQQQKPEKTTVTAASKETSVEKPKEESKETPKEDPPKEDPKGKEDPQTAVADSSPISMDHPGQSEIPSTETTTKKETEPTEMVPSKESGRHIRCTSDLNKDELEVLKHLFMSEMKQGGIDVEGKYHKSSVDFDSPLMFLLDLHIFAETQHSGIKLEQVLRKKYGDDHSVVSEFSEAASHDSDVKREAEEQTHPQQSSSIPPPPAPTEGGSEQKDAAQDASDETKEKQPVPVDVPSVDAGEETEKDKVTTEQQEIEEQPPVVTTPDTPLATVPLLRDETMVEKQKTSCFACICLRPNA